MAAGPAFGPRPRTSTGTSGPQTNRERLINNVIQKMGLTQEAIRNYSSVEFPPGSGKFISDPGAVGPANTLAATRRRQLDQLSERALSKLNTNISASMRDQLNASQTDINFTDQHLQGLAELNKNVESVFARPQGRAQGHPLAGLLSGSAGAMISGGMPSNMIAQTLGLISKQKDYGTGRGLLQGIQGLTGAAASSYIKKNLSLDRIQAAYRDQTQGVANEDLTLFGRQALTERKRVFTNKLNKANIDDTTRLSMRSALEMVDSPNGMGMLESFIDQNGYTTSGLKEFMPKIVQAQQLERRHQYTLAESVNKYTQMSTTRGKIHAITNLVSDLSTGTISFPIAAQTLAIQGATEGIKRGITAGLATGMSGAGGGAGALAAILPGGVESLRALSSVGNGSEMLPNLFNAILQLRNPLQTAQMSQQMALSGMSKTQIQGFMNLMNHGSAGIGGSTFDLLRQPYTQAGLLGPNTNMNLLNQTTAFNTGNASSLSLATSNYGGMALNPGLTLAGGMMQGLTPDQVFKTATSQKGGLPGGSGALVGGLWDTITAGMPDEFKVFAAAKLAPGENPYTFVQKMNNRKNPGVQVQQGAEAMLANKRAFGGFGIMGTGIGDSGSSMSKLAQYDYHTSGLLSMIPGVNHTQDFGYDWASKMDNLSQLDDNAVADQMMKQANLGEGSRAELVKGIDRARANPASSSSDKGTPANPMYVINLLAGAVTGAKKTN